jgi:hypothetical protein
MQGAFLAAFLDLEGPWAVRATTIGANTLFASGGAAGSRPGSRARKATPAEGFAAFACIRTGIAAV